MAPAQDQALTALVLLGICATAVYVFVLWVMEAPRTVNPWGKDIDEVVNRDDAIPVCHHCFTPQPHNGWFCPECGAIVGAYCNYMPYLYIFSEGEVLRAGVTERMRRVPLIVIGYIAVSIGMFAAAAPIYWFFLFKNLTRSPYAPAIPTPPTIDKAGEETVPSCPVAAGSTEIKTVKKCKWCGGEYSDEVKQCPIDGNPLV